MKSPDLVTATDHESSKIVSRFKKTRLTGGNRHRGFTLLELLIAMSILVVLGGALVTILRQGVDLWHTAEKRAAIYERARVILDQVAEDIRSAAGDSRAEGTGLWIRFICDADPQGLARLRLTRAVAESRDPILREGGKYVETSGGVHADLHGDAIKARDGMLLPPGGYEEVLYAMDPEAVRPVLWRGIRSPPGGGGSLFLDRNIQEDPAKLKEKERARKSAAAKAASAAGDRDAPAVPPPPETTAAAGKKAAEAPHPLTLAARPFADGVLHLSFAFWAPFTTTWDRTKPARPRRGAFDECGPIVTWDSTRAFLDEKPGPNGEFGWRRIEGSADDPGDDLFPERVEVTLVVAGNADIRSATLTEDLSATDRSIVLSTAPGLPADGPDRFVWIEGEWIGYEKVDGPRLEAASAKGFGRGARGTRPAAHARGAAVETGTTFRRVIEVPAGRIEEFPKGEKKGDKEKRKRS